MSPLVSVIIVNWNGRKWLERCLSSLAEQTYQPIEVLVVDNDSADDSVKFIREQFPLVRVIESRANLGFAGGNNLGIREAKGEYIMLLNNDTWVKSDFVRKMFESFQAGHDDVLAPSQSDYQGIRYKKRVNLIDPFGHPVPVEVFRRRNHFYLPGVCLLFRKSFYLATGGLDDDFFMYCEEVDWFWRLHLLNKHIRRDYEIWIYHAGAGSSGSGLSKQVFEWRNVNTLQMILKNYSWYTLIIVLPLLLAHNCIEASFFFFIRRPDLSKTYIKGWSFNVKHLKRTLSKRIKIQETRKVNDLCVLKKMYYGSAKFGHLKKFYTLKKIA